MNIIALTVQCIFVIVSISYLHFVSFIFNQILVTVQKLCFLFMKKGHPNEIKNQVSVHRCSWQNTVGGYKLCIENIHKL